MKTKPAIKVTKPEKKPGIFSFVSSEDAFKMIAVGLMLLGQHVWGQLQNDTRAQLTQTTVTKQTDSTLHAHFEARHTADSLIRWHNDSAAAVVDALHTRQNDTMISLLRKRK